MHSLKIPNSIWYVKCHVVVYVICMAIPCFGSDYRNAALVNARAANQIRDLSKSNMPLTNDVSVQDTGQTNMIGSAQLAAYGTCYLFTTNMQVLLSQIVEAKCAQVIGVLRFQMHFNLSDDNNLNAAERCGLTRTFMREEIAIWNKSFTNGRKEFNLEQSVIRRLEWERWHACQSYWGNSRQPRPSYADHINDLITDTEKQLLDVLYAYYNAILFEELNMQKLKLMQETTSNKLVTAVQRIVANEQLEN